MSTSTYDSTVNSFYLAFYGRPADPAGLAFWSQALQSSGGDLTAIANTFATSEEATVRFGADTAADRIAEIYQQLFNRAPDQAGLDYWTGVVGNGHATLADVAIDILQGARGTDLDLSNLRQQAADTFTAQVAASGSAYDGYAAIEAARVLVRAVTLAATQDDIATLVKSATAFADVATKTPAVVDAIGVGSTLVKLFDTARGSADPVALAQTLSDVAKAAAGNPDTLDSLLRGGGMSKVLQVMPANATLHDVVDALAKGGLPAAVEVVYPTAPGTGTSGPELPHLSAISYGPNDGNLAIGETLTIKLAFNTAVQVDDGATITLNNHGTAHYTGGSGTGTLVFTYVPHQGETVADLATAAQGAFTGTIHDAAGNQVAASSLDNLNPAGTVAIDGELTTASTAFTADGLAVTSNKVGNIYLVDALGETQTLVHSANGGDAVAGTATLGEQDTAASGTVTVKAASGATGSDASGTLVGLGSAHADTLSGQYVWGFGGDDSITGTTGSDHLVGGAGNDTLRGGIGADVIEGGQGADTVVLAVYNVQGGSGFSTDSGYNDAQSGANASANAGGGNDHGDDTIDGFEFGVDTVSIVATGVTSFNHSTAAVIGGALADSYPGNVGAFASDVGLLDLDANNGFGEFAVNFSNASGTLTQANWQASLQYDITGTSGNDTISTGAKNDVIRAGAGADTITGGHGADLIDLGSDSVVDTVVYGAGDTAVGVFANGGSTAAMDVISGMGSGDVIKVGSVFGGAPAQHTTYLADATADNYAIVRGSDAGGVFTAGTGAGDNDYMVQWADGTNVNSVVVHDFGTGGMTATIDPQLGTMKLAPQPVVSHFTSAGYAMTGNPSLIFFYTSPSELAYPQGDDISHLNNAATFSLKDMSSGVAVDTDPSYTSGDMFGVCWHTQLRFGASMAMDLYKMSWQDDTFTTTDASGYVAAGSLMFAGGVTGGVLKEGFTVNSTVAVSGATTVTESDAVQSNDAFIDDGDSTATIMTGGGMDVVSDNGGTLTIAYDTFDASAQDLILGFDTGNDKIQLGATAASLIDANQDNGISWVSNGAGKAVVVAGTEGVEITTSGVISSGTGDWDVTHTLDTLNTGVDLTGMQAGSHLLILANNGQAGALYDFQDLNGNHTIDAGEATIIAMFSGGIAHGADVQLVGAADQGGGIPGG